MAAGFKIAEAYAEMRMDMGKFSDGLTKGQQRMKRFHDHMQKLSRTARMMFLGIAGAIGLAARAYAKQEAAENSLAAAFRATGQEVEGNMRRFGELASAIQRATVFGDEEILALQAQAVHLGINADRLEQATRMAVGLATALKMDVATALRYTALALQGEFTVLQRYIPALRQVESAEAKMVAVMRTATAGYEAAKEETQTLTGQLKQLKNALGDLCEALGAAFVPGIKRAAEWMKKWSNEIREWSAASQKLIKWLAGITLSLTGLVALSPRILTTAAAMKNMAVAIGTAKLAMVGLAAAVAAGGYALGKMIADHTYMAKTLEDENYERQRAIRLEADMAAAQARRASWREKAPTIKAEETWQERQTREARERLKITEQENRLAKWEAARQAELTRRQEAAMAKAEKQREAERKQVERMAAARMIAADVIAGETRQKEAQLKTTEKQIEAERRRSGVFMNAQQMWERMQTRPGGPAIKPPAAPGEPKSREELISQAIVDHRKKTEKSNELLARIAKFMKNIGVSPAMVGP